MTSMNYVCNFTDNTSYITELIDKVIQIRLNHINKTMRTVRTYNEKKHHPLGYFCKIALVPVRQYDDFYGCKVVEYNLYSSLGRRAARSLINKYSNEIAELCYRTTGDIGKYEYDYECLAGEDHVANFNIKFDDYSCLSQVRLKVELTIAVREASVNNTIRVIDDSITTASLICVPTVIGIRK